MRSIALGWQAGGNTAWGVTGLNLAIALSGRAAAKLCLLVPSEFPKEIERWTTLALLGLERERRARRPVPLTPVPPLTAEELCALDERYTTQLGPRAPSGELPEAGVVLHALDGGLRRALFEGDLAGARPVGLLPVATTRLADDALGRAARYDRLIVGSAWARDVLAAAGLDHVRHVPAGVDPNLFHPAPAFGVNAGRFVVYSGGRLGLAGGQDIVVAAFRAFRQRHADALLAVCWQADTVDPVSDIGSAPHGRDAPTVAAEGRLEIRRWLVENGLPPDSFVDLGPVAHRLMPAVLRECDVAVFANRCAGGACLAPLEAMASGVPTVLSANTGHRNLLACEAVYPLTRQRPVDAGPIAADGWGESSVDELVAILEMLHGDRDASRRRALSGAAFAHRLDWRRQAGLLVEAVSDLL